MASPDFRSRTVDVGLPIALEVVVIVYVVYMLLIPMSVALFGEPIAVVLLLLVPLITVAIVRSVYRRWRDRRTKWEQLNEWENRPLRLEGQVVIQTDATGAETGRIDTTGRYSVRWERFDDTRALYIITQREQTVTVSTLAPDAAKFLLGAFKVRNYPCVDWPNFDL